MLEKHQKRVILCLLKRFISTMLKSCKSQRSSLLADNTITLGAETFAGRKFRDFRVFWHFSRKFLPRHNLNSKFAKVFAREITGNSRLAKIFTIHFLSFLQVVALLFLNHPDL